MDSYDELVKIYPDAFRKETDPIPFALFGFECGIGWVKLIEPLISYIDKYNKEHTNKIRIYQIKEKYGTLRFYTSGATDKLHKLINKAEKLSGKTCERCGAPGKIRGNSWYYVACDEHTNDADKKE